jgi:DNA-binding GntR family transcriptional regulator
VLEAIARRDGDAAAQAMRAHLDAIDASLAVLRHPCDGG